MKIMKILVLRSSMIGVGLVVGGLALAVWHFSGNRNSATENESAAETAAAGEETSAKSQGMVPVKDLETGPIQPPTKAVLGDQEVTSTDRSDGAFQPALADDPPSPSFVIGDQDRSASGSDFVVSGSGESPSPATGLKNPAAENELVSQPASLPTGALPDSTAGSTAVFQPESLNSETVTATQPLENGIPSPANLTPNGLEAVPLQPPPSTVSTTIDSTSPSSLPGEPGGLPLLSGQPAAGLQPQSFDLARPGAVQFDGQQTPQLTIEKRAPAEIQVNQLAIFEIKVRNVGQVPAHQVRVRDFVPQGTQLERASPAAAPDATGAMTWNLGTLQPGQQATISMHLMPLAEGQIGSVATVDFQARASVRTTCTKPQLMVKQSVPEKVLIGKDITIAITVSNSGSGDATNVVLVEDVPEQLTHVAGRELEYPIGTLRPGETKQLSLKLRASKAGLVRNVLSLRGTGKTYVEDVAQFEVIAPQLQVALEGPKVRYLDRPAKYSVTVANPGTAPANNIELVAYLPKGLKFVDTDHHGRYDQNHHAVLWSLEELPANVRDSVSITALPIESGEQRVRLEGRASLGLADQFDHLVQVESVAQLMFRVTDLSDPIEQGNETTYEIRVTNVGTRAATGIQLAAALSPELQPISGNGPTAVAIQGQQVFFGPLERIAPRGEAVYKITAKGLQHGDHLIRVQIVSNESPAPVTKEESTRVYQDK